MLSQSRGPSYLKMVNVWLRIFKIVDSQTWYCQIDFSNLACKSKLSNTYFTVIERLENCYNTWKLTTLSLQRHTVALLFLTSR